MFISLASALSQPVGRSRVEQMSPGNTSWSVMRQGSDNPDCVSEPISRELGDYHTLPRTETSLALCSARAVVSRLSAVREQELGKTSE